MAHKLDKELQEYKNLMEVPSHFDDGFTLPAFFGAIFIALVMIPGAVYMQLIAGVGIGGAAQWVTVILFIELAKRANATLKKAEIFILFYMAGAVISSGSTDLLFRQFFVRSEAAVSFGLLDGFPEWYAPKGISELPNTFIQKAWLAPILLMIYASILGRIDTTVLGYGLFRLTSDVEKLPFPMAPMGAQGMMTLAEDFSDNGEEGKTSWRWRSFAIGGALGMAFGFLYMGIPTLSGAFLSQTIQIFPIPFIDWTPQTAKYLPAVATGLAFDLGSLIVGMVLPFFAMIGSFVGLIITIVLNPVLFHMRLLPTWDEQQSTVETLFSNNVDFYFSFGIGLSLAIAIVGVISVIRASSKSPDATPQEQAELAIPKERGDIPNWLFLSTYVTTTVIYTLVCGWLIDWHKGVMIVLVFFGFVYTPLISYVTARLEGLAGQVVDVPYIREIAFILSGYQGLAVWFMPFPAAANYGAQTVFYKTAELTGTSFRSIWKVDALLFPIILLSSIGFSSFIFTLGDIPSAAYPYTMEIWEFNAKNAALIYSSTLGYYSPFSEAFRISYIAVGLVTGLISFSAFAFFNAPTTLCYGIVRGFNQTMPHSVVPQFIGACLGQFVFRKKFGENWKRYIIVVSAGYFVGSGLISMLCVGVVFLSKSSSSLPY